MGELVTLSAQASGPPIPDAALETHIGILGKTGRGKSYTARGLVERLLEMQRQVVIIDPTGAWWGLRLNAAGDGPGFDVPIFGGDHGDVEISDKTGDAVAGVIVDQRASAVIDLSKMSGGGQRRFMTAFAHRLRAKPRGALYLVVDEADEFMPQNLSPDMNNLFGDLRWIVRRGRLAGFRVMMVTQRPAEIAKAMLTQIETLVAHGLTAPQDRKAIEEWVKGHHDPSEAREVLSTLAGLDRGEAWVWSPDLNLLTRSRQPAIATFDSGRTPEPGEEDRSTVALAALDLSAIREALAVVEEPAHKPKHIPAPETGKELAELRTKVAELTEQLTYKSTALAQAESRIMAARAALQIEATPAPAPLERRLVAAPAPVQRPVERAPATASDRARGAAPPANDGLTGPQRQLLAAIAWWNSHGIAHPTKAQVCGVAGWRVTSGHIKNVAGSLRSTGMIEYPSAGCFALTDEGQAAAPAPDDAVGLHDQIRTILNGPQLAAFNVLTDAGSAMSREDLANACGWNITSGHIKNVLGSLRSLELIDYPRPGEVRAADWLFP